MVNLVNAVGVESPMVAMRKMEMTHRIWTVVQVIYRSSILSKRRLLCISVLCPPHDCCATRVPSQPALHEGNLCISVREYRLQD
jgi:hypothetical protein